MRYVRAGAVVIAEAPPRRVSGRAKRAPYCGPRRHKLSPVQEAAIRANAGNRTLRELAAEFGVGYETIHAVLPGRGAARAAGNQTGPVASCGGVR